MGQHHPETRYDVFTDPEIKDEDKIRAFSIMVGGFYKHGPGETVSDLEQKHPLAHPVSTPLTMTKEELSSMVYEVPGCPGGSDITFALTADKYLLLADMRKTALFPPITDDQWAKINWRHIWCDHSFYDVIWGKWSLEKEIQAARQEGTYVRPVEYVRVRGGNHFVGVI